MVSLNSFKIGRGDLVSLIGSGGKTTLMYKLAREAAHLGMKVLSTTTTHIFVPTPDQTEKFILLKEVASPLTYLREQLTRCRHLTVAQDYTEENKVRGLQPELICKLRALNLADLLLVEADGSRQKLFKAPGEHEPVIPDCSTHCILVVNLKVIGKPLNEEYVHRSQRVSEITGLSPEESLTPRAICSVINSPKAYRNKIPSGAATILFLNGVNHAEEQSWAEEIQAGVDPGIIHTVVWGDLFN